MKSAVANLGSALAAATAFANIAAGQELPVLDPANDGGKITLSAIGEYHSNIARTSAAVAEARGLEQSDFRMIPTAAAIYQRHLGRTAVAVDASAGYQFHARNTLLDRERLSIRGLASLDLQVCNVAAQARYVRKQSDLEDLSAAASIALVRNVEAVVGGDITAKCGRGIIGIKPFATVGYVQSTNTNDRRALLDYDQTVFAGGLDYFSKPVGNVRVFARRTEVRFDNQTLVDGSRRGYDLTNYGVGYARKSGANLKVDGNLTYAVLNSRQSPDESYRGLNWTLTAQMIPMPAMQIKLQTARQLYPSRQALVTAATYYVDNMVGARVDYAYSSLLRFDAGYSRIRRHYFGIPDVVADNFINDEFRQRWDLNARYKRNKRWSVGAGGAVEKRRSDNSLSDYTDYLGLISFDYSY